MASVHTLFDCKHETEIKVQIDSDVEIPDQVRGLGKCPDCLGQPKLWPVPGVAPQPGGQKLVVDSIMLIPVEG